MKQTNHWEHFDVAIEKDKATAFLLLFLSTFKNRAYFDRENNEPLLKLKLHVKSVNATESAEVQQFMHENHANKIKDYQIQDELSELFFGKSAEKIYVQASMESMHSISDWLTQIEAKQTSLLDLAFVVMSLYLLHADVKGAFFSNAALDSVPYSFLSFRSHVDGYLIRINQEESYRKKIEALYQERQTQYHNKFTVIMRTLETESFGKEMHVWRSLVDNLYLTIHNAIHKKHIDFKQEKYGYIADNIELSNENLHKKTQGDFLFYYYTRKDKSMKALRLITGLIYLTLHRLGLSYLERNFLCYVLTRTVEDLFHTNVDKSIKEVKKSIKKYYLKRLLTLDLI